MKLRDYQEQIVASVEKEWENVQSTLVVAPTGSGKTVVFCALAGRAVSYSLRVMVLVDRTELVKQTQTSMHKWTGIVPDIEQADLAASTHDVFASQIVIATVQTLRASRGKRRDRFDPMKFDMLICDEAHLAITETTLKTIAHFATNPDCRIVGLTATPMRGDNRSLEQAFQTCAFRYSIREATDDGWLVPVRCKILHIESLDLSALPGGKKDWTSSQVGRYMEVNRVVLETAQVVIDHARDKQTIIFCARVAHAEAVAKRLNYLEPGSCAVVHGKTPKTEREAMLRDFNNGDIKRIANCGVLVVGFDSPSVEVIVNARPTKSAALFTQITGRALRPLPGVVDGPPTPELRRQAIADSAKPHALIISLVGRDASMNLAGPVDVFAGTMTKPELVERAKELMDAGDIETPEEALILAEEEFDEAEKSLLDLENAPIRVHLGYTEEDANLYKAGEFRAASASEVDIPIQREVAFLISAGFSMKEMRGWSGDLVRRAITEVKRRHTAGLASKKQCNLLNKLRVPAAQRTLMSKGEAQAYIQKRLFSNRRY